MRDVQKAQKETSFTSRERNNWVKLGSPDFKFQWKSIYDWNITSCKQNLNPKKKKGTTDVNNCNDTVLIRSSNTSTKSWPSKYTLELTTPPLCFAEILGRLLQLPDCLTVVYAQCQESEKQKKSTSNSVQLLQLSMFIIHASSSKYVLTLGKESLLIVTWCNLKSVISQLNVP